MQIFNSTDGLRAKCKGVPGFNGGPSMGSHPAYFLMDKGCPSNELVCGARVSVYFCFDLSDIGVNLFC